MHLNTGWRVESIIFNYESFHMSGMPCEAGSRGEAGSGMEAVMMNQVSGMEAAMMTFIILFRYATFTIPFCIVCWQFDGHRGGEDVN